MTPIIKIDIKFNINKYTIHNVYFTHFIHIYYSYILFTHVIDYASTLLMYQFQMTGAHININKIKEILHNKIKATIKVGGEPDLDMLSNFFRTLDMCGDQGKYRSTYIEYC